MDSDNINTWKILNKELNYFGIKLLDKKKCQFKDSTGKTLIFTVPQVIKRLKIAVKNNIKLFYSLWEKIYELLEEENYNDICYDENLKKLFIFSLKDLQKLLYCFEECDNSIFSQIIDNSLKRDINSYNNDQIDLLIDYKISIDWIFRLINRLRYLISLLQCSMDPKVRKGEISIFKMARGVSGPWANLDLPKQERMYAFENEELRGRSRDKRYQRRYQKGLDNYNAPGVGDGHYFREVRNEPFSWYSRKHDSPYPGRSTLMN